MTDVATKPARARPARASAQGRAQISAVPRHRPPRRVSGPAPRPARAREASRSSVLERLSQFLRGLPDHALLDRLVRGRAWIPLLGLMLGGIVAMQVELLKLNATTGRSIELASTLQSRNQILRAEVAADSAPGRIERLGARMGMIMPGPEAITFLRAGSANTRRAAASIQAPDPAVFVAALQAMNSSTAGSMPLLPPPPPAPATTTATSTSRHSASAPATTTQTTSTVTTATTTAPPATVP